MKTIALDGYVTKAGRKLEVNIGTGAELAPFLVGEQSIHIKSYRHYLVLKMAERDCAVYDNMWEYIDSMSFKQEEIDSSTAYAHMFNSKVKNTACTYKGRRMILVYPEEDSYQFIMWDIKKDLILNCKFKRDDMDMPSLTLSGEWIEEFGSADVNHIINLAVKRGL